MQTFCKPSGPPLCLRSRARSRPNWRERHEANGLRTLPWGGPPRGVNIGYLKFALAEPGLFRTAFSVPDVVEGDFDDAKKGESGLNPFELLSSALDKMVSAGVLPAARRPGAEYVAWSAVHGLAFLVLEGPLRGTPAKEVQKLSERLLQMVENGL